MSSLEGTPKWMVYNNGTPYFLMDDLGGKPTIFGNIHMLTLSSIIICKWEMAIFESYPFLTSRIIGGSVANKTNLHGT